MATYFGYVEREADSYVNWADVGRNMSATIDNIQRVRDEKKALIEKAYREDLDYIQAIPSGEHKTLRDWSIGFGNDAAENLKLKYSLLKQGKSSVKDFTSFRENITNDTESLYKTINDIQTVYKEKMDRFKNDENMDLEMLDMAQLERFGNLSDTKSFINGLTGSVGVGLTEEVEVDGKKVRALKKGDDAYLTVQQLVAAVNRKYDNYDVRPDIAKWVDGFGEKIKSLRQFGSEIKAGSIIEVMDITNEELMRQGKALGYTDDQIAQIQKSIDDFNKAEDLYLKGLMVDNPYHTLATLNKRLNYQPTFSKEEAAKDPNKVYCERDSSGAAVPKFTPDQEKAVFDYMKGQARLMYDEKVKLDVYQEPRKERPQTYQPNQYDYKVAGQQKTISGLGSELGKVYSKGLNERQTVLKGLQSYPGVNQGGDLWFSEENNGKDKYLNIISNSGSSTRFAFEKDGVPVPLEQFGMAVAPWIYGDANIVTEQNAAFKTALEPYKVYSKDWGTGVGDKNREIELWKKREAPKEDLLEKFKKETFEDSTLYWGTGNKTGAKKLNLILKKYGIKAVPNGYYGIDIKDEGDNLLESISVDSSKTNRDNYFTFLKAAVEEHLKNKQPQQQGKGTPGELDE